MIMPSEKRMKRRVFPAKQILSITAASLILGSSVPAEALSLRDLFLRGVQVIQLSNISTRQEVALGEQMHRNLLAKGMRINRDRALNSYLGRVGSRIARETRRSNVPYRFFVVDDNAVNAYATSGGFVYVTKGLMKAADNEAQLASVVAHEAAHIDERHLIKQIRKATIAQGLVATALGSDRNVLAGIGVELLVKRPQGRGDEFDADEKGLRILRDAGYATSAMPAFMTKLLGGRRSPTFLSTHPAVPDRLNALENRIRSGYQNECDRSPSLQSCGLSESDYNARVRSRIR